MVYYAGVYHMFFQYHPFSSVWGPMHWGHATSTDMMHWQEQPIALYPDSLGMIFSGSAVLDKQNSSGFGINGRPPLVAIFTHHNDKMESGRNDFQYQSLAFSTDSGKSWKKYAGNPVLKNPGITDFRDPKVILFAPQHKWVMTLATKDCITFYSSPDLRNWKRESDFGKTLGSHGGVWECPDLVPLNDNGKKVWMLIVNVNPGGPNGGSATQYFLGDFNGHEFVTQQTATKWLDFGPDEYAGVTWSNTGNRVLFLGWMSNWLYANQLPTMAWRNAMTLPRALKLVHSGDNVFVSSLPVVEMNAIQTKPVLLSANETQGTVDFSDKIGKMELPCRINIETWEAKDFAIRLANMQGEELVVGYNKQQNNFFIDRSHSGKVDFYKDFGAVYHAPRFRNSQSIKLTLVVDVGSIELFADDGLTVMTSVFFPNEAFSQLKFAAKDSVGINKLEYVKMKSTLK